MMKTLRENIGGSAVYDRRVGGDLSCGKRICQRTRRVQGRSIACYVSLQNGHRGCRAIWNHIMNVSVTDLKKNYERLNVEFDLWKGEADAQKYIPDMVQMLKDKGYARYDEGALVVDVQEESDNKEVPPCMILKV